jgi:CheY-like chemotaxis protein
MPAVNSYRPRVLVADPDPETCALLGRQLEWAGYDVTTAGNGRDALDLTTRLRPQAVILEATMEMLNGYQVVGRLRDDPRNRAMPIIMISARAGKLDRDFAFTVGADDYVRKPFLTSDLVARVALLVPSPSAPAPVAKPIVARPQRAARRRSPVPALAR